MYEVSFHFGTLFLVNQEAQIWLHVFLAGLSEFYVKFLLFKFIYVFGQHMQCSLLNLVI
jgi:hypothetical protein